MKRVDPHPLVMMLDCAVPLLIEEFRRYGGPDAHDYQTAQDFHADLAQHGDDLLYGGKPGEAADLANRLARSLAVMAFVPGGVRVFGRTWCANEPIRGGS